MRSASPRNYFKTGSILLFLVAIFFAGTTPVKAFQGKTDTVSSTDVQFTSIPTKADTIAAAKKRLDSIKKADSLKKAAMAATTKGNIKEKPKTLWELFFFGLGGGFLAFLMPCIYPLLPLTVSFFLKLGGSRLKAIGFSIFYGLSIIVIFVSLGLLITIWFGPNALNAMATNGVFNILLFLLLVVFAISFFGAFEIVLPSALVNKIDEQSNRGGLIGIFFMALTLVVVSFSCTGLVIGGELAVAVTKGERLGPAICMLGFSLTLALPFVIFALFPSAMQSLPKSGGWLNSIKVVLGFVELGLALKFLSVVDLAYHWNWFDREIFLSLWIAIGILLGLYLIGKLKFSHDSDLPYLSVPRLFIAIVVFAFVVYMIPGLWGAPLNSISGFLPPPATQDFDLTRITAAAPTAAPANSAVKNKKYETLFHRGHHAGMNEWYDYNQALQVSKEEKKPILIDFTGWGCTNCRKMENSVWINPQVRSLMQNDFILLELYVDEKTDLPPGEMYTSQLTHQKITTIGDKNSDRETTDFDSNSQPLYVIIDSSGKVLEPPQGANYSVDNYVNFLSSGIAAYKAE
ncbi:MAG TPA: thioredoxin family protein [Mucilaginibacter sp.]|jgi:thiol:disulfide interchange protein DsbD|nr:thioredoxin family protein [Mucilaginibacter sp.]